MIPVGILAGGLGTRLSEETVVKPKPMVEIGGRPILWHIMKHYAAYGVGDFYVALGYKGELIKDYFLNYRHLTGDFSVDLATGEISRQSSNSEKWRVNLMDTGQHTQTGGRIKRMLERTGSTMLVTYGDGVADIDVNALLAFHHKMGRLATVTAVRPPARFGLVQVDRGLVKRFEEKPSSGEGWINGGFFVLDTKVADYIEGDATIFERAPLERLAADGQLAAFEHEGFWHAMDTLRDVRDLETLWQNGNGAWKR